MSKQGRGNPLGRDRHDARLATSKPFPASRPVVLCIILRGSPLPSAVVSRPRKRLARYGNPAGAQPSSSPTGRSGLAISSRTASALVHYCADGLWGARTAGRDRQRRWPTEPREGRDIWSRNESGTRGAWDRKEGSNIGWGVLARREPGVDSGASYDGGCFVLPVGGVCGGWEMTGGRLGRVRVGV